MQQQVATAVVNLGRDEDATNHAVAAILDAGPEFVFTACVIWAEIVHLLALDPDGEKGDSQATVQVVDVDGTVMEPEELPPDIRAQLWGARIVAAQSNRDHATVRALLGAQIRIGCDARELVDHVAVLVELAGAAVQDVWPHATVADVHALLGRRWTLRPSDVGHESGEA